jgi:DNA-binding response OmpR family regulator
MMRHDTPAPCILIIDDEPDFAASLAAFFADEGYETTICSEAPHAINALNEVEPDLLILDLLLPDISGWELLTAIRLERGFARLPIVIMTSGVNEGRHEYQRRQPAHTRFLPKPLDLEKLLFTVEMLLHPNLPPARQR